MRLTKNISTLGIISLMLLLASFQCYAQNLDAEYAYVSLHGKPFSKKLRVVVDFGDEPDQIQKGEKYSEALTNKKSFASVLNYMVKDGYELVESLELISLSQGNGGTQGISFIMRKSKE